MIQWKEDGRYSDSEEFLIIPPARGNYSPDSIFLKYRLLSRCREIKESSHKTRQEAKDYAERQLDDYWGSQGAE